MVAIALALLMVAGWLLPSFFSAERYRRRLEAGLERALDRPVKFGAIAFRLLPRPGFSIEKAVLGEDPAFGSEPLARVDRIECDLRWRSLWRSRLELARLRLEGASFNVVRDARGRWNLETLLLESGVASPPSTPRVESAATLGDLVLEADDARLNFKIGANKKPLAITELQARLSFDRARGLLKYRLAGKPIRTDISLPTPGVLELEGEWTPGKALEGPLNATLRTRGALLYDWVPLVTGRNPEIYGVLDAEIRLSGSIRTIKVAGESRLVQLHRWEQIPPSDQMPCVLYFRGEFDRNRGRALLESVDVSFAQSHVHVTGSVDRIPSAPELDLVVALERSRLEDLLALGQRLGVGRGDFAIAGRVDGLLAIQGSWVDRRYGGFVSARDVRLNTPSGQFPVSEVAVKINAEGASVAPVKVALAPRVELTVDGKIELRGGSPRYELALSARAIPLRDFVGFARAVGVRAVQNLDAQGVVTATFRLTGPAWPLSRPVLQGRADLRAARLLVPGLTEPLNIPRARIRVDGDHIVAEPVVAVMGTSVFTGRVEHRGERKNPWRFNIRGNQLSLEQGSLWFDVLGRRRPVPLLERLPGIGSLGARRAAALNLFSAMNAQGRFAVPTLTYRALTLRDFRASVDISGRRIRISAAKFRLGGGRGQGKGEVDLTTAPARLTADVSFAGSELQPLAARLPPALVRLRGSVSGTGHFEARGLTCEEIAASLRAKGRLRLRNVFFGDFDPLEALVRKAGSGTLEPLRGEVGVRFAELDLQARDRRVILENCALELSGAKLRLGGIYAFDGTLDLDVYADLRRAARRWLTGPDADHPAAPRASLRLAGPLDRLAVVPESSVARASR